MANIRIYATFMYGEIIQFRVNIFGILNLYVRICYIYDVIYAIYLTRILHTCTYMRNFQNLQNFPTHTIHTYLHVRIGKFSHLIFQITLK